MERIIEKLNSMVWGVPMLILILGMGVYFTIKTGFVQLRLLPEGLKKFFRQLIPGKNQAGKSSYRALCTALGATVGTGNLVGVAGAIALGGPGSVFWIWVSGILGMVTKFAEVILAVQYRRRIGKEYVGGPMYIIQNALGSKWKPLACIYAFLGIFAALGVGNATQVNAVVGSIRQAATECGFGISNVGSVVLGIGIAVLIMMLLSGGGEKIGRAAELLVPFAAVGYVLLCLGVLILCGHRVAGALVSIVKGAWNPSAVTGGLVGSSLLALRTGISRGVFTNEAGMGTASIAHASAKVSHPVQQGMMGIVEVFLDTIVICTLTALVILCSGVEIPYGIDTGVALTVASFSNVIGHWSSFVIALFMCCFSIATILGWGYYGARCAQYLLGDRKNLWRAFAVVQGIVGAAGAILGTGIVWQMSEMVNGLMAIPNLVALFLLRKQVIDLSKEYKSARQICRTPKSFVETQPFSSGKKNFVSPF